MLSWLLLVVFVLYVAARIVVNCHDRPARPHR